MRSECCDKSSNGFEETGLASFVFLFVLPLVRLLVSARVIPAGES
jgi:hypothetical protein